MGRWWSRSWTLLGRNKIHRTALLVASLAIGLGACSSSSEEDGASGTAGAAGGTSGPVAPNVTGLSDDSTPTQSKVWSWACDTAACEYRYVVNTNTSHSFSTELYDSTVTTTQGSGDEVYYLHVQAIDTSSGLESSVVSVSAILDNTVPTDPSALSEGADATETTSATLTWTAATDTVGLSHYEIAIGTSAGATDVVAFTHVGDVLTYQFTGLSLTGGASYFFTMRAVDQAGNQSATVDSAAWIVPVPPATVSNLLITSASPSTIDLGWSAVSDSGYPISDYLVEYKLSADSTWTSFDDGVSTDTAAIVTGLSESTSYDFRVRAYNGATGAYSNVATGETTVDDPFFDPTVYQAMNLGGATESSVVALEDTTTVNLNGSLLTTLNAGEVFAFTSALNDIVSADKPIFVAGRNGTSGASDNRKGNMVWSPPDWAGKEFLFTGTRNAPHLVTVYAFEDADITITQGASSVDSQTVTSGNNHTFSINLYGGFQMNSTGLIIAFMYSSGGTTVIDPKPLLPASSDILGFPSTSARVTSTTDSNSYNAYHSNSSTSAGTLSMASATVLNPQGTSQLYQSNSLRIVATDPVVANSNADSNGYCSAPFIPVGMMKKRYALNTDAEWVAFASLEPGTIDMIEPGTGTVTTLTLTQSGADPSAPYSVRTTSKAAGFRFVSTVRFGAWYEPSSNTNAADNDETILFGVD